ncbi:MAG: glycosyltransferase family 9 protein [Betaproteobacteria bacterium]|nr:glycosyltransferase family 9 protein [Betaproteobacteria bacterium]
MVAEILANCSVPWSPGVRVLIHDAQPCTLRSSHTLQWSSARKVFSRMLNFISPPCSIAPRTMDDVNRVLIIRRDNIGDLVCTTPLIAALRQHYPRASIDVLANSYNAPVLDGNPDIDNVFAYRKLKHLEAGSHAITALASRVAMLWSLRRKKFDLAVVAAGAQDARGERLAKLLGPARIVQPPAAAHGRHEVEYTFTAARMLGIEGPIPPLRVVPGAASIHAALGAIRHAGLEGVHPLIGVHISARRPSQRWPAECFAELIVALGNRYGAATMLLWSPGPENHPQHPGDDDKAATVISRIGSNCVLLPYPTLGLSDLIGALSICDAVVCSDGGAMHLAAGLGRPIACFFGDSPVERWRPWGVQHIVLQAGSRKVEDIPVEEAVSSVAALVRG